MSFTSVRASADAFTGLTPVANGEQQELAADELGRLWVRVIGPGPGPSGTWNRTYETTGSAHSIKPAAGRLKRFDFYNRSDTDTYWLMIFNLAAAPVLGSTPAWPAVRVPPNSTGFVTYDDFDIAFGVGIAVGASSTEDTFTAPANPNPGQFGVLWL